jgi:GDP-L-fucose synthase
MVELSVSVDNDIFNIGGGVEYPIRWYAEKLSSLVGYDAARIQYDTSKYVGATSKFLSVKKIKEVLPHFEPVPLEQGLEGIVGWYLKHTVVA